MGIKHELADCENCPLLDSKIAPTCGPLDAKIAIVSRSPNGYDVRAGKPFAGPSGRVLDHLLQKHGVTRDEILTTNVVLCKTDNPTTAAIKACKSRLEAELAEVELIVAAGAEATNALTKYGAINKARGFRVARTSISGKRQTVVATNNPAIVYKKSDAYPDLVADFRRAFDPPPPPVFPTVEIIDDERTISSVLAKWRDVRFDYLASDLEWNEHIDASKPIIECAGFSRDASKAFVFAGAGLRKCLPLLKEFYNRSDIKFIWHNGKADTKILRLNGIAGRTDEDTFFQSYALDERPGYHKLEYLLSSEFGWPDYEPESVRKFKTTGELPNRKAAQELYKYNGYDTAGTFQLFRLLSGRITEEKLEKLYRRLLYAGHRITTVELNGFNYDVTEACNLNERTVIPKMWELRDSLRNISTHPELNPNSNPQMKSIYYGDYGLKHGLRDTGKKKLSTSTGREVREEIAAGRFHCIPEKRDSLVKFGAQHQRYAKVQRIQSNYIIGLIRRAQRDGKLYCHFNLGGTATGRTSSSDPNFQNIIRQGFEDIPGIRTLFLPSPGNVLVAADYSQAELRTCAKLSNSKNLKAIYADSSRSLHKERAAAFYGPNYTKEEYVKSKNINFGVTYGQSAFAFAQMYHMPVEEAQAYIDSWWAEFPDLLEWTKEVADRALADGYTESPFGHRRRIHLITDDNIGELRREAVNFLPQNIAAWLTICSICDLVDSGIPIIATVHDSIVADVAASEAIEVAREMQRVMQSQAEKQLGWLPDDVPFLADLSIGPNWGDVKEVDLNMEEAA